MDMKGVRAMGSTGSGRKGTAPLNGAGGAGAGAGRKAETPSLPAFDDALARLEETVRALESGQMPLDEALAVFEQGIRLAQVCQEVLDRAELRVHQLVAAADDGDGGVLTVEALEIDVE
jgi:exodeoxyribonuclease VII small subunit